MTGGRHGIHDTVPATRWEDGFPAGDGECGLVALGDPLAERLLLGRYRFALPDGSRPRPSPGCAEPESGPPEHQGFVIELDRAVRAPAADYRREADVRTGEVRTRWTDVSGAWRSRAFVSRADRVIVYELAGPVLDLAVRLSTCLPGPSAAGVRAEAGDTGEVLLTLPGADPAAPGCLSITRLVAVDGRARVDGEGAVVRGASRLVLLTALNRGDRPEEEVLMRARLVVFPVDYDRLLRRHLARYAPTYEHVELGLGAPAEIRWRPRPCAWGGTPAAGLRGHDRVGTG